MSIREGQSSKNPADISKLLKTERIREEIRGLLRFHYRPSEVYSKLGLSRSEYYRHLKAIRKEDQRYIMSLRGADFATSVRVTIETLEDLSRQLALMAQDAPKDCDKIAAIEMRYQIELDILNVEKVGPSAVPIATRMSRVGELNSTVQNKV
jgi:hypothetical protein